jgi:eukaryotic-like serine/threonine-protein kinase
MPGRRIGPYRLETRIGAGAMGEVYRTRDPALRRGVAVTMRPRALAGRADRIARFEREARVLAVLDHPNIVPRNLYRIPIR